MGSTRSITAGSYSTGKVESPVEEAATGQHSNDELTVTDSEEGERLHNEASELQTSGIVRWNVYESVEGYDRKAGKDAWGEWKLVGSHETEYEADRQIQIRKDSNHRKNSMNDYGIINLRWEKRHELILPANLRVTQQTSVTDSEEIQKLQNQVTELQKQVKSLETKLKYARKQKNELEHELTEVERFNRELQNGEAMQRVSHKLQQAEDKLQTVSRERFELQNKLQTLSVTTKSQPDYETLRTRTLNKLKAGRQSTVGKAIDAFIRELKHE